MGNHRRHAPVDRGDGRRHHADVDGTAREAPAGGSAGSTMIFWDCGPPGPHHERSWSSAVPEGLLALLIVLMTAAPALAANGITVKRGEDALVFGNCVPSLVVENMSAETIDYLQVELVLALTDGQE